MENQNNYRFNSLPTNIKDLLRLWVTSTAPVDRRTYLLSALVLIPIRFLVDSAVFYVFSGGHLWSLLDYMSPFVGYRFSESGAKETFGPLIITSIPFLWIATSLSIRRCIDAGRSAFLGLMILVPILNWFVFATLATLEGVENNTSRPTDTSPVGWPLSLAATLLAAFLGVGAMVVSVFHFGSYGSALFLGTPFLQGLFVGYATTRGDDDSLGRAVVLTHLAVLMTGAMMLSFALEGLVCLLMAYPIWGGCAVLGSLAGYSIGRGGQVGSLEKAAILLTLPALLGAETHRTDPPQREVISVVEIDAPPEVVWPLVVGFTELPPISEWEFRLGIAHPIRARIEGHGVGAVRYCEFSTGPFVEPITHWEEPYRLAFDVLQQPEPMHEWSPYKNIDAPHLLNTMRSQRGEFRLIPIGEGRTRLEGSTWYEIEMFPQPYWGGYSDALVHTIHNRVLRNIKLRAEQQIAAL